jgi:hypothetical protein
VKAVAWARVYVALERSHSKYLRRGTWYPVVRDDLPDRISLQVGTQRVDVPRRLVEIRLRRPTHFSVITRTDISGADGSLANSGRRYSVCPVCAHRTVLLGSPNDTKCGECGHIGEIGWWEA